MTSARSFARCVESSFSNCVMVTPSVPAHPRLARTFCHACSKLLSSSIRPIRQLSVLIYVIRSVDNQVFIIRINHGKRPEDKLACCLLHAHLRCRCCDACLSAVD